MYLQSTISNKGISNDRDAKASQSQRVSFPDGRMKKTIHRHQPTPRRAKIPEPWPPTWVALPDSIEEIEAGRPPKQAELFGPDDSRPARVARLLAIRGVTTADRLPPRSAGPTKSFF
jgi:hypothetical protein